MFNQRLTTHFGPYFIKQDYGLTLDLAIFIPLCKTKFLGGYIGFSMSVHLSVGMFVRRSVDIFLSPSPFPFFFYLILIGSISILEYRRSIFRKCAMI